MRYVRDTGPIPRRCTDSGVPAWCTGIPACLGKRDQKWQLHAGFAFLCACVCVCYAGCVLYLAAKDNNNYYLVVCTYGSCVLNVLCTILWYTTAVKNLLLQATQFVLQVSLT